MSSTMRISVIDSHTEGEPTRVVVDGWPQPEGRTMAERLEHARARATGVWHESFRKNAVRSGRGFDGFYG